MDMPARSLSRGHRPANSSRGSSPCVSVLTAWLVIVSVIIRAGAAARNGSTGMLRPAAAPAASAAIGRGRRASSRPMTASGTTAQTLTATANPNAAPPQASRLFPAIRSPSNTSSAPIRNPGQLGCERHLADVPVGVRCRQRHAEQHDGG